MNCHRYLSKSLLFVLCYISMCACVHTQQNAQTVKIIFDSDMGPDYDDVGAITMLHAFADSGKAEILATIASTNYENVAAVFSVFNTYFKRPGIPIAVPRAKALSLRDNQHWSDSLVANYPHSVKNNQDVPDAVELYRKILSAQPDNSVTIVTVGFLTNIANLLKSQADNYSKLSGVELVQKKVKQLVCMAGKFPSGSEFNVDKDAAASKYAFEQWPGKIIFSGFEIGEKIKTGLPLSQNTNIQHSPVKDVFRICISISEEDKEGRKSWDETAVLVAVNGTKPYFDLHPGTIIIAEDGSNTWSNTGDRQAYLVQKSSSMEVQQLIEKLIAHQPY